MQANVLILVGKWASATRMIFDFEHAGGLFRFEVVQYLTLNNGCQTEWPYSVPRALVCN